MSLFQRVKTAINNLYQRFKRPNRYSPQERAHLEPNHENNLQPDLENPPPLSSPPSLSFFQTLSEMQSFLFIRENRLPIAGCVILTFIGTGINFLSPFLFGKVIESLSQKEESSSLFGVETSRNTLLVMLCTAYTVSQIIPNLRDQLGAKITAQTKQKVTAYGAQHLLSQSFEFYTKTEISDLIYVIQKSFSISTIASSSLIRIFPALIELSLASTLLSILYSQEIGMGMVGLLSTYSIYTALTAKPIVAAREVNLEAENKMWGTIWNDLARRIRLITDYVQEERELNKAYTIFKQLADSETRATQLQLKLELGHIVLSRAVMLLGALYVGSGVAQGEYTVKQFTVLFAYLNQLSLSLPSFGQALNQFCALYPDLQFAFMSWKKTTQLPDPFPQQHLELEAGIAPAIEFDQVSFSYPEKNGEARLPVFQNLSLTIPAGSIVALISESGAGKTTLFNLLFRYYDHYEGTIRINGADIRQHSIASIRQNICYFGQTPNLYNSSVRDNIRYSAPDPNQILDDEIFTLAQSVHLKNFLMELGLDSPAGEGGKALSGGQQQKIAMLRGLFKKGSIRLFDEATAALDNTSAADMLKGLKEHAQNTTSIMITHKLTEIIDADLIVVLEKGAVSAQGSHQELLKSCSLYQKLWKAYQQEAKDEKDNQALSKYGLFKEEQGGNNSKQNDSILSYN